MKAASKLRDEGEALWGDCEDEIQEEESKRIAAQEDALEVRIRDQFDIPYGVCLFPQECVQEPDLEPFMKFAKWWVKGEWDDEIADLFCYHYCEMVEVDYFWVLMEQPGYYYTSKWKEWNGEPTYDDLLPELKAIGTRSKRNAQMNFKLNFGHGIA